MKRVLPTFACIAALLAAAPASASGPYATVVRTIGLDDSGRLHLASHHGFTLNERGTASGTIHGPLYIHLHIVSTNRVTAEVTRELLGHDDRRPRHGRLPS
jgi:hypothetical protein